MIYLSNIVQFADTACKDITRLTNQEIQELQDTYNAGLDDLEIQLDNEELASLTILEEEEYFKMYGD